MKLLQIHEPGQTPLPHADTAAVGIDLGTTNSVVAVSTNEKPQVIQDAQGRALLPSAVYYRDGKVVVGAEALTLAAAGQAGVVSSVKRRMGSTDEMPVKISAEILRVLKAQAEQALGKEVSKAVITVPAYFDDAARQATKDAAKLAGLEVLRLINEPTAAALAYGLDVGAEGIYAVYDLGGGTFDISLLRLQMGVFQVLATGGDTALGGDDIDAAIVRHWGKDEKDSSMLISARQVKEALSDGAAAAGKVHTLSLEELNAIASPLVAHTLVICQRALEDAKLTLADIKGVVMVGGSTRMTLVRQEVAKFFGTPPLTDANPDEVVALGAAIQAEALTQGSNNLLLDVIPLSLGMETMGGIVEKIIHRNTPIPASVSQEFTTYQDGQSGMKLHVVQGERERADQCRSLARFELAGIPPMPAGLARVKVSFDVDADGLLSVSAEETTTGAKQRIEVKPSYGLAPDRIEQMLRESMEHAREDIMERLLIESRVEAQRSVQETASAMQSSGHILQPEEKEAFDKAMLAVKQAIEGSDREAIDHAAQVLHDLTRPFAERRMNDAIQSALKGKAVSDY